MGAVPIYHISLDNYAAIWYYVKSITNSVNHVTNEFVTW